MYVVLRYCPHYNYKNIELPLFRYYATIEIEVIFMRNDVYDSGHLISDDGVQKKAKKTHITLFIALCRVITAILAVLGFLALFVGAR